MSTLKKLWLAFFFLAGLIWLGNGAYDDEKMAENRYCSMLSLYASTNGAAGWPAFKPEIQCKSTVRN
tara:strand:+ start:127 stop:327 length:201 start_codon:yes stop_codon:yes gene_type:complete